MERSDNRILIAGLDNNRGGTETVVDHYVSELSNQFRFDFLVYEDPWMPSVRLGDNRVFVIPRKSKDPLGFARGIRKHFSQHHSEYSALWMNFNNLSNIEALKLAYKYGIPKRISHAHNTKFLGGSLQQSLSRAHRKAVICYSTDFWACSEEAGEFFFPSTPFETVANAFRLEDYTFAPSLRLAIRAEYGLGQKFVLGNIGRLDVQKNQRFLLDLAKELKERGVDALLMILGEGPLRSSLSTYAEALGIEDSVLFAGNQSEVRGYLSAFDAFAFPSLWEGLGLAVVEAQINGLPCAISEHVPSAALVADDAARIPLRSLDAWADWCEDVVSRPRPSGLGQCERFDIGVQSSRLAEMLSQSTN